MIGSLRGRLLSREPDEVLVEVSGVGYRVTVSPSTSVALGETGGEVFVWTHHHIREDAQVLYGFETVEAKRCFAALLGAHGVGPALALAILSVHSPRALARVLLDDDLDGLCLVPGVGKKTAARLLVELKGRLDIPADLDPVSPAPGAATAADGVAPPVRADVREALAGLGYGVEEIREAMVGLPDVDDAAALLKAALQKLAVRR